MKVAFSYVRKAAAKSVRLFVEKWLDVTSRFLTEEVARRNANRGTASFRWFTSDEARAAEALANVVVPADPETPGLEDVGVLGPSSVEALDHLIAESPHRQILYAKGLLAFDTWALLERGCVFAEMTCDDQLQLFSHAERIYDQWTKPGPSLQKAYRWIRVLKRTKRAPFFAAQLFPQIRNDCLQVFYTSRVSWLWLEYDGPPMNEGYPKLEPRRSVDHVSK